MSETERPPHWPPEQSAYVPPAPPTGGGSWHFCFWFGIVSLLVGLWFLLVQPTISDAPTTVNLHRVYFGQAMMIVGAIFLAAAMRPR